MCQGHILHRGPVIESPLCSTCLDYFLSRLPSPPFPELPSRAPCPLHHSYRPPAARTGSVDKAACEHGTPINSQLQLFRIDKKQLCLRQIATLPIILIIRFFRISSQTLAGLISFNTQNNPTSKNKNY